ncbi:RNA pseudouridylate synthase domain-containing protein 2 [Fasciola hepatica]|uniref:RNA pseudouridylate synthase domain-containing protein 2 n=1 Tax=Fasciola hepatica TaxID=6192 RepID=A0A4E0RGH3_FASHE|nr:RNA pseudouridylate synthase domain-containing protein 2 [Fasciola hepatica]
MEPAIKIPRRTKKISKEEKKVQQKSNLRARRQEKKRLAEDFDHYENVNISEYYFENQFRKVFPYVFTFKAYAKRRWIDRTITDILDSEFNFSSMNLIVSCICNTTCLEQDLRCKSGEIQVNGQKVTPDYRIRDTDLICHRVHRHELPVLNTRISFIHEDDDVLVFSKPASIPVHPCGQYTLNSMVHILAKEYNRRPLRFVHRLDRMTSGVMIAAKNYDASLRIATQIGEREVKKFYICRTDGLFPNAIGSQNNSVLDLHSDDQTGVVVCTEPLGPLCCKMGLHAVIPATEGGKSARTHFIRLAYDAATHTSLVLCRLYTGRTHQIRVHLQFLGYPIVEDPLYNSTDWGPEKGKGAQYGMPIEEVIQRISASRTPAAYVKEDEGERQKMDSFGADPTPYERFVARVHRDRSALDSTVQDQLIASFDPNCPDCQTCYRDPEMRQLVLQLHAYRYTGSDWTYTAPLPEWAMAIVPSKPNLTDRIEACIARLETE